MITLAKIDNEVQLRLRNLVGSPLTQSTRVSSYNSVIDFLQSKSNWNATKKVGPFEYLNGETDYSIPSIDRALKDLVRFKKLQSTKKGVYRKC